MLFAFFLAALVPWGILQWADYLAGQPNPPVVFVKGLELLGHLVLTLVVGVIVFVVYDLIMDKWNGYLHCFIPPCSIVSPEDAAQLQDKHWAEANRAGAVLERYRPLTPLATRGIRAMRQSL